jgi:outer membrane murein-binding lipoprotein Lpp
MRAALLAVLLLAGCASRPPVPDWQGNAHSALQAAVAATLNGEARVAEAEMARARSEIARTGQPALLARAELVLCAARVASLDLEGCPAYTALAQDAGPAEQAYAAYLYGEPAAPQRALLPPQHQRVAAGGPLPAELQDPLARLLATAVLLRQGRAMPGDVDAAVQVASAQGWRRPLLAWLGAQLRGAQAAGDAAAAERIRRRIALVD